MPTGTGPRVHKIADLVLPGEYRNDLLSCTTEHKGRWVPARPIYYTLGYIDRIKYAWGVITGKYDVLDWDGL